MFPKIKDVTLAGAGLCLSRNMALVFGVGLCHEALTSFSIPVSSFAHRGVQNLDLGGCKCTPFRYAAKLHKSRIFGGCSFNDRQGGARGCIVNRV